VKLLLDIGCPRGAARLLTEAGFESAHGAEFGLGTAEDTRILEVARRGGFTLVTLDADFHTLLALSGEASPSVIRVRQEGLRAPELTALLLEVLRRCRQPLEQGALVSVRSAARLRLRLLPIVPDRQP
jgi:predicted nuclease of predicted toxin-antitoxin system